MKKSKCDEFVPPGRTTLLLTEAPESWNKTVRIVHRSADREPLDILILADSANPWLVPIFPLGGLFPGSKCPHAAKPIRAGSILYCPICEDTGLRNHRAVRLVAADIPAREPEPTKYEPVDPVDLIVAPKLKAYAEKLRSKRETRKQRRARLYAQRTADGPC